MIDTRERFIPIGRQDIVEDLLAASHWSNDEDQKQTLQDLTNEMLNLLNNGNYEVLDKPALEVAMNADSYYR